MRLLILLLFVGGGGACGTDWDCMDCIVSKCIYYETRDGYICSSSENLEHDSKILTTENCPAVGPIEQPGFTMAKGGGRSGVVTHNASTIPKKDVAEGPPKEDAVAVPTAPTTTAPIPEKDTSAKANGQAANQNPNSMGTSQTTPLFNTGNFSASKDFGEEGDAVSAPTTAPNKDAAAEEPQSPAVPIGGNGKGDEEGVGAGEEGRMSMGGKIRARISHGSSAVEIDSTLQGHLNAFLNSTTAHLQFTTSSTDQCSLSLIWFVLCILLLFI